MLMDPFLDKDMTFAFVTNVTWRNPKRVLQNSLGVTEEKRKQKEMIKKNGLGLVGPNLDVISQLLNMKSLKSSNDLILIIINYLIKEESEFFFASFIFIRSWNI